MDTSASNYELGNYLRMEESSLVRAQLPGPGSSHSEDTDEQHEHIRPSPAGRGDYQTCISTETDMSNDTIVPKESPTSRSQPVFAWLVETLALVVAIGALIAVAAVLAKFNNQHQPDWPGAAMLNLSALVALLATPLWLTVGIVLEAGGCALIPQDGLPVYLGILTSMSTSHRTAKMVLVRPSPPSRSY